jgi:SAM-dependent methyltransferase
LHSRHTHSPCHGEVTPDGSPVEVYRRLPPLGEAELISAALPHGAEILELGCGTGRVTHRLLELGHAVTAVDESAAMLAHVRGATTVRADIRTLKLGRRFDAVVLGSHFVNVPDAAERVSLLAVCARHVSATGPVLVECYAPAFAWDASVGRERAHGQVTIRLTAARRVGDRVDATVEYRVAERRWEQRFEARLLDERALRSALAAAGLRFERWLDRDRGWFEAHLGRDGHV